MGIRVHKAVGFGRRDFVPPKGFNQRCEDLSEMKLLGFAEWMRNDPRVLTRFPKWEVEMEASSIGEDGDVRNRYLEHSYLYDPEFGFKDAILLCPIPMLPGIHRYDDTIDWLEERPDPIKRWKFLDLGIHPYVFGHVPASVVALAIFLGMEEDIPFLREALYVKWS